jgi:Arc/MetJ family transcription regulator
VSGRGGRGVEHGTNIELDDDLVEAAMRLHGTRSKRETVDLALRRLVGARLSVDEAIAMEGSGREGDLDRSARTRLRTPHDGPGRCSPPWRFEQAARCSRATVTSKLSPKVSDLVVEHPQP